MDNLDIRRSGNRGKLKLDWLDARFSFSFGPYAAPDRMGFGPLLALNEDVIQPGAGFDMHPHQDMEIFIIPLTGVIEHRDSLGNHAFVVPGTVQRMSAGTGILHSQMNASSSEIDRHLQIWLRPRTAGMPPGIEQRAFDRTQRVGRWQALATPDGRSGSLTIDQDASIHVAILNPQHRLRVPDGQARSTYLHVIDGSVTAVATQKENARLGAGDAIALPRSMPLELIDAAHGTEVILFDLPAIA